MKDSINKISADIVLKESDVRIKSVFRSAPIGIGVVSNRIIVEVNEHFCEMTGYKESELIGQNSRIVYTSDEEFERVGKYIYEQIKKYGTGSIETQFKRKDGKIIDIVLSSTPVDPDDLSIGVTFTALDITEQKKAEDAALKWAHIFQHAEWGIVVGNADEKTLDLINPAFAKMHGYTEQELTGNPILDVFAPEVR